MNNHPSPHIREEQHSHAPAPTASEAEQCYEAYCVKCKVKREIRNVQHTTAKNGKSILKGVCSQCGCGMTKFMPKDEA